MPPDSYVDWGAVHFYTPLNRTGEQILTDEDKSNSWSKIVINEAARGYAILSFKVNLGLGLRD